jgi:hypothetical protein
VRAGDLRREESLAGHAGRPLPPPPAWRGELPASLDDLRADPRTFVRDIDDPVTGAPYGYRPTGPRTYELTATFDLESPPQEPPNGSVGSRDGFFTHGPGPRTFTVTVPEKRRP